MRSVTATNPTAAEADAAAHRAVPGPDSPLDRAIGLRVQRLRQAQGLSLAALAARSGVSKAMISRVERAQNSATAALLGRLAAGLGVPLAALLVDDETQPGPLRRLAEQPVWRDPAQGYLRRQVAPHDPATGVELVEVLLPRGAAVAYPPWQGRPYAQRLWLLEGALDVRHGEHTHHLAAGDCLDFAVDRAIEFQAQGPRGCRYLLVMAAP